MSEEIGRQIEDAAAARSREAASRVDRSQLADFIVAGATRRRRVRAFATGAFAVVAVLAVGGGTVAAMSAWGPDAVAPATQSATPTATATGEWSTSPPPSPTATAPAADGGLDGIADYPALARARGEGFPAAYVMEDWVWDHVGPGWSLESYSLRIDPYVDPDQEVPNAAVYLASPDGATFELAVLDRAQSAGLRILSWREDERTATVDWEGHEELGDAAELDLETGALDPLDFTMPGKVHSNWELPLAVSAAGTELWKAYGEGNPVPRFYRWSHDDGWTAAAVNDLPGIGTTAGFDLLEQMGPGVSAYVRSDGRAVALGRPAEGPGLYVGQTDEIAIYDLDRDLVTLTKPTVMMVDPIFTKWLSWDTLEFGIQAANGEFSSINEVAVNGAPEQGPVPADLVDGTLGQAGRSAVVGFDEATANGVFYRECSC